MFSLIAHVAAFCILFVYFCKAVYNLLNIAVIVINIKAEVCSLFLVSLG